MLCVKGELKGIKEIKTAKGNSATLLSILSNGGGDIQVIKVVDYKNRGFKPGQVEINVFAFPYYSEKSKGVGLKLVAA